jgi:hypothetical protein
MSMPQADSALSADSLVDVSQQSTNKSQRKRDREKQRRSDLASAFDELSNLLLLVQDFPQAPSQKKAKQEQDTLTRFDLIGGTIQCIRKLHRENQELKQHIESQRGSSRINHAGSDNEEVLVMLPTLVPADERSSSPAARGGPSQGGAAWNHYKSSMPPPHGHPPQPHSSVAGYYQGPPPHWAQNQPPPGYAGYYAPPSYVSHSNPPSSSPSGDTSTTGAHTDV